MIHAHCKLHIQVIMYSLLQLPQNLWRDKIVYYLRKVEDLVRLDSAVTNKVDRRTFHDNISGCKRFIMNGIKFRSSLIKWLTFHSMIPEYVEFSEMPSSEDYLYIPQFLSRLRSIGFTSASMSNINILKLACSSNMTSIYFNNSTMDDVSAIASCINLTNLTMFHCPNVTDESFAAGIAGCVQLDQCCLHSCEKLRATSLAATLQHCISLTVLNVGGSFDLQQVFVQLTSVSNLKMFECVDSYRKCQLTGQTIQALAVALPDVTRLYLDYRYNSVTDSDIDVLVRNCQALTNLTLCRFVCITNNALARIAQHLPGLKTLNIEYSPHVTDAGVISLCQGLTSLQSIDLKGLFITDAAVQAVGTNCRVLSSLDVSDCSLLTDDAFLTLNVARLTSLKVCGTRVTGTFAGHVLSATSSLRALFCLVGEYLSSVLLESFTRSATLATLGLGPNKLTESDWIKLSTKVPYLWTLIVRNTTVASEAVIQSFRANCPRLHNVIKQP